MPVAQQIYKFRSQFSEFEASTDAEIANAINFANLWVDQTKWSATDYPQAVLLWAAHYLSLWLLEKASVQFGGTGDSSLFVSSVSFGERHVTFGQRNMGQANENSLAPGEQMLMNTMYGQMFLMLRSRNIIPIAVI